MVATATMRGFTVIEVMLFLGITGAMFAALMIGVNTNVTQQRYRESVQSYGAMLQNQFAEVSNPRNERDDKWSCTDSIVKQEAFNGDARGSSKCVILGRAIQVTNNGKTLQTYAVVGVEPAGNETTSDIDTLNAYQPKRALEFNPTSDELDWNSTLQTTEHLPSSASYLILRSPASGLIRVFTSVDPLPADLSTIIKAANATASITNCVDGDRGLLPPQSVTVNPNVAGQNGVYIQENDQACA